MMGGSCSSQRRHHDDTSDGHRAAAAAEASDASHGCTSSIRRRGGRFRSGISRFCGGSQDESSDEEGSNNASPKRTARHSVDAEIPNHSIAHLYPIEDNYELHETDPTLRCPKSLTDLCVQTLCRSLPNLEGELPPGLPQDIVDRIVQSLTSHSALNCTTLRTLARCELGSLNLARCRGVSDEWLTSISSFGGSCGSSGSSGDDVAVTMGRRQQREVFEPSSPPLKVVGSEGDCIGGSCGGATSPMMMMDLGEGYDEEDFDYSPPSSSTMRAAATHHHYHHQLSLPLLPTSDLNELREDDIMEDCCGGSFGSRSTSSFVSATDELPLGGTTTSLSTSSSTPLLPSVLPPPDFFNLSSSHSTITPTSSLWLYQTKSSSLMDTSNALVMAPLLPRKPSSQASSKSARCNEHGLKGEPGAPLSSSSGGRRGGDEMSCDDTSSLCRNYHTTGSAATSTITLLDLRGSQHLSDRGLLHLSHTPLCSLEIARLDNCHGITGRGLLAFSRSYKLHTLSLSNCRRLTDEAVVNVSHLGVSLITLNLGGCRCLTDRSLEAMSGMLELRQLDLSQCDLITDEGLTNLANLHQIEELSLGWCRLISDDGLKILSEQQSRSETLRVLHLARCAIKDDGLLHLSKLEKLEELDLNGCSKLSGLALSFALEKLPCLSSLDVSYCPGILRSSWQGKINSLKSLELCYSAVRDSHLSRLKHLPMLEELNLDSCLIGDWAISHLSDNNVVPNLKSLDLADTDISDYAMSKIAQFEHLETLSLFYCNISNAGLKHLSSMKNLEVLNLDSREIGDDGLRYLRHLPLKSLDLFSGRVTDLGCAYLSKIKTLSSLELCGGGVGDLGCAHLATIYNLTSLNLSQNERITNRGAASLAALSNLKALNLSNTHVNSEALKFFSGLSQLQSLALYGCKEVDGNPKLDSLQSELPLLRCVRLNGENNEDGVIYHGAESSDEEEDEEEGGGGGGGGEMDFNFDDEGLSQRRSLLEHDHFYHQWGSEAGSRSSEEGMSVFEDAHNEEIEEDEVD